MNREDKFTQNEGFRLSQCASCKNVRNGSTECTIFTVKPDKYTFAYNNEECPARQEATLEELMKMTEDGLL